MSRASFSSPSTAPPACWDRGGEFVHYQQLPSLQDYLLVSTDAERVEHFTRGPDGTWTYRNLGPADVVRVPAIGLELQVARLYAGVPAEPVEASEAG